MRKPLTKHGSQSLFKATANKVKSINLMAIPMRGGFRL